MKWSLFSRRKREVEQTAAIAHDTSGMHTASTAQSTVPPSPNTGNATRIDTAEQLPPYSNVLTAPTGSLPVPAAQHREVALLGLSVSSAALLCVDEYYGSTRFFALLERARKAGISVETLLVTSDPGIPLIVYSKHQRARAEAQDAGDTGESSPSAILFDELVTKAVRERATDIHVMVREDTGVVAYRIDGAVTRSTKLPAQLLNEAIGYAYTKLAEASSRSHSTYNARTAQYCAVVIQAAAGHSLKLRYQSFPVTGGFDVILRLLFTDEQHSRTKTLEELGYESSQRRQLTLASRKAVGAVFLSGVTGSGKTTTLKTLMTTIPGRERLKSYSIEDPAEYKMYMVSQISVQRETDSQAKAVEVNPFVGAMRNVMRADPDVIMVGEIRDTETGSLAKTMTQSGHKVFTTVHAAAAIEVIERLTSQEIGLSRQTLASRNFLNALVYQRLIRVTCPHCSRAARDHLPSEYREALEGKFGLSLDTIRVINPEGCEHCDHRGFRGQTVVAEIITPDITFLRLVLEGRDLEAEVYWRRQRRTAFDDADMTGKTAFEHALYKMSRGILDPYVVEEEFEAFESYEVMPLQEKPSGEN